MDHARRTCHWVPHGLLFTREVTLSRQVKDWGGTVFGCRRGRPLRKRHPLDLFDHLVLPRQQ